LIGSYFSEEVAVGGFHAKAGWLIFCGLALGLIVLSRRLHFFSRQPTRVDLANPTAAYLLPFLTLLALAFTTGLFTRHIDLLYAVRIGGAVLVLFAFRHYYADIRFTGARAAFGLSVLLGLVAFAVFVAVAPRPEAADVAGWQAQWAALPAWGKVAWMTVRVLGSVIVIPIAEELAFRGYLMRRLVSADFETVPVGQRSWLALAVSSLAFGAVHGGWVGGTAAGLLFGLCSWFGGSLVHPILAHVVANAAVAVFVLVFGGWWIWM
jgi:CAAX prenyl protease-like protein